MGVTARKGRISKSTYVVAGDTLEAINKDIERKGPKDPNDGKRYSGLCSGRLTLLIGPGDFALATAAGSSPVEAKATLSGGTVTSDCEITLPKLASAKGLSAAAKKEWDRFLAAVETHEDGHVDAYFAEAKELAKELNAMSASGTGKDEKVARVAAQRALVEAMKKAYGGTVLNDRAGANAKAYDARTKHGESQGAVLDGRIA